MRGVSPFLLEILRLTALVPLKCGMTTLFEVLIHLTGFILSFSFYESTLHTMFLHFQDRRMTSVLAEIFSRNLSLLWNVERQSNEFPFFVQSMSLTINMNRKNYYSLKLFWTYSSNFQIFLGLSENLKRCESWEIIPLELNWFSIDSR